MTGTGIPLDTTESHHTLTSEEKIITNKQEKQRSCLMKFAGFGATGRARDRITDDEIKARSKKLLSA